MDGLRGIDMDAFRFINSKDIRNYLEKINYEFTPIEIAWLVYQCFDATQKEKFATWNEIINTMPDCPVEVYEGYDVDGYDSLHKVLKEYMENGISRPFYSFRIDFPLPFKTGDIVHRKVPKGYNISALVYDKKSNTSNSAICYAVDSGRIDCVYLHDLMMDLEYFTKGLPNEQIILNSLSDYLKGKMRLDHLLNDYLLDVFEELTLELRERQKSYFHFRNEIEANDEKLPY